jgi:hypothetical protein
VRKVVQRVEDSVAKPTLPRRGAHAIEKQRILALRRSYVVVMVPRIDLEPRHAAFIKLLKQRPEPVGVLVINSDGFFHPVTISMDLIVHESSYLVLTLGACLGSKGCFAAFG